MLDPTLTACSPVKYLDCKNIVIASGCYYLVVFSRWTCCPQHWDCKGCSCLSPHVLCPPIPTCCRNASIELPGISYCVTGSLPAWALTFQWAEWMNWPEGGQSWEDERSLWESHLSHIVGKMAFLTAGWGDPVPGKRVHLTVQWETQRRGFEGILCPN